MKKHADATVHIHAHTS